MIVVIVSRQRYWTSMTKGKQSAVPLSSALVRHVDSLHILASKQLVLLVQATMLSVSLYHYVSFHLWEVNGAWKMKTPDHSAV